MKLLVVLLALLVLFYLLRGSLQRRRPPGGDAPAAPPQAMLRCAECGLHLPAGDALPGRGGVFCGEAHRAAFEREHPAP